MVASTIIATILLKKRLDEEFGAEEEPDTEQAQLPTLE